MTSTDTIITEPSPPPQAQSEAQRKQMRQAGLRLAALSGLLLFLANPPAALWPLAWVALVPLILSVTRATRLRQALWRGYVFGWTFLGPVWYWIGLTIVGWTGSNIGWVAWFGLTTLFAGFYALWGGAAWWLARRGKTGSSVVTLAALWVVIEWLRTLGSLTMPWAQVSYTQVKFLPVLQIADVTGAYGVSFLILLVNGALAFWWTQRNTLPHASRYVWMTLTLTIITCLYGLGRLWQPEETTRTVTAAAMQSNFSVFESPDEFASSVRTFESLTQRVLEEHPETSLTVWSESASPGDALYSPPTRNMLTALALRNNLVVLVGSHVTHPLIRIETNSSVMFLPNGDPPQSYAKQQLVAFGEFIPFRRYLPAFLANAFHFFPSDVEPGNGAKPFRYTDPRVGSVTLGPYICYESMYPQYARQMTREGAELLVTQSNDAWFHSVAAMEQHLSAVVYRAIENRRDTIRGTNTGITCLLDAHGRILERAPLETPAYVAHSLRLREGRTLYTRFGDWFVLLCGAVIMILVWKKQT